MRKWVMTLMLAPACVFAQDSGRIVNWLTSISPNHTILDETEKQVLPNPNLVSKPQPQVTAYSLPSIDTQPSGKTLSQAPVFFAREIQVKGVTALDSAEIKSVIAAYENREVSSADLQELRLALSHLYLDHNYMNSGVILPDQEIQDGVIYYEAIEGALTRIEVDGDTHLSDRYVTNRIKRHVPDPLNIGDLQYALQILQNDPNVDRLDARLAPGDSLGESVLRVAIDEPERFEVGIVADNHRASSTGAEHAAIFFASRNMTGYGDVFRASGGISDGADDVSAAFSLPITRRNTELQFYYSRSDSAIVEDRFQTLDIESLTDTWGFSLTQPIVDSLSNQFSLTFGFEAKHSETTLLNIPFSFSPGAVNGEADTSVAQLGLDWVNRGSNHVVATRATYRRGLDLLDATIFEPQTDAERMLNPTGADGEFDVYQAQVLFLYRLNAMGFERLNDRSQLVFRTTAQLAGDPLMSLEKLPIGGVNTVRGYPENLLVRDQAVAATLEFQIALPGYDSSRSYPGNLILVPFVDYGRSWDKVGTGLATQASNTDDAEHIIGAGLGLIWEPIKGLKSEIYWGADISDSFEGNDPREFRDTDLQDDGIHIGITYSFAW